MLEATIEPSTAYILPERGTPALELCERMARGPTCQSIPLPSLPTTFYLRSIILSLTGDTILAKTEDARNETQITPWANSSNLETETNGPSFIVASFKPSKLDYLLPFDFVYLACSTLQWQQVPSHWQGSLQSIIRHFTGLRLWKRLPFLPHLLLQTPTLQQPRMRHLRPQQHTFLKN